MTTSFLHDKDIDTFIELGYVVVRNAISPEMVCEWLEWSEKRIACWQEVNNKPLPPVVRLVPILTIEVPNTATVVWRAACELLGGEDRITDRRSLTDGFIVNSPILSEEVSWDEARASWQVPTPESREWHIDGDWFRHFLDSPEWNLTALISWTDSRPWAGATLVAPRSHYLVSRHLCEHPEGIDLFNFGCLLGHGFDWVQVEMNAGDVLFLHPHLLHCSSQNVSQTRRIISTSMFDSRTPPSLEQKAKQSPVVRAILRGIGVDSLSFRRTREVAYASSRRAEEYPKALLAERQVLRRMLA